MSVEANATPSFWRDDALPFIEARSIEDGRKLRYGLHAHSTFSIGAVTGGRSTYLNGKTMQPVSAGAVVVINPDTVHACNPVESLPWAYRMFHVEPAWLAKLQHAGDPAGPHGFRPFATTLTTERRLFTGLNQLYDLLVDAHTDLLAKESAIVAYFTLLQCVLDAKEVAARHENRKLARAAEFIDSNYTRALKLEEICAAADLSASYLIRAFREHYGMTPHAYLVNRRIEFSRAQLRRGHAIADVAAEAGFADQAHLQRAFRQFVAATPGQYRG